MYKFHSLSYNFTESACINTLNAFGQDLLADYTITSALETTLGANQWASDAHRLAWTAADATDAPRANRAPLGANGKLAVTLQPMQIRSFIIQMSPN